MTTPDVRVKLSAEGVDEVVRALQKVNEAAKRTGKEGGAAMALLSGGVTGAGAAIAAIAATATGAIAGIAALTKAALESTDAIGKLSQKTGLTTKTLSVLKVEAETADASIEQLTKSFAKFSKLMGDVDAGTADAAKAVKDLFGSTKALDGLNSEQRFLKVAAAIGAMGDGYSKSATAQQFFGKSGAEMIPLLNDIAQGGFDKASEAAKRFGLVVDQEMADAAQSANDGMKAIQQEIQGAATQFAAGIADSVTVVASEISHLSDGNTVFRSLGESAGQFARDMVYGFEYIAHHAKEFWDDQVVNGKATWDILKTGWAGYWEFLKTGNAQAIVDAAVKIKAVYESTKAIFKANATLAEVKDTLSFVRLNTRPTHAGGGPSPAGGGRAGATDKEKAEAEAAAKAQIEALKAHLDDELKLFSAFSQLSEQQAKAAYDRGFTNLKQYFDRRRDIIVAQNVEEINTLQAKRDIVAGAATKTPADAIKQRQELDKIDSEIEARRIAGQEKLLALETERADKEKALVAAHHNAMLQELQDQGQLARGQLDLIKGNLDNKVASGELFPTQALQQYNEAVKAAVPVLREKAEAQLAALQADLAAAQASLAAGGATQEQTDKITANISALQLQIQQAQAGIQGIDALGISANQTAGMMANLKSGVESTLSSGLTTFFDQATDGAHSMSEAFQGLAKSVLESLKKMLVQMLINLAIQKLLGAFGGGGGGAGGGVSSFVHSGGAMEAAMGAATHADGGPIEGPGTSTSDSIPAWLSSGEWVHPALTRKYYGDGVMEAMRTRSIPRQVFSALGVPGNYTIASAQAYRTRFAEGGLVQGGAGAATGKDLNIGLFETRRSAEQWLATTEGEKAILGIIGQNPVKVKGMINQ